ncbi:MAG: hypothetical protein EKK53_02930 [Burkholderiales bacterium]|nr:MAG: hypothetical protein EKK53_02930 [Burkholderiales bacterium]
MPLDAHLPQAPALEISAPAAAQPPLLSALTRWWSAAATDSADAELGYESALPWVLTEPAPVDKHPAA